MKLKYSVIKLNNQTAIMKRIILNLIIPILLIELSAIPGIFGQKDSKSGLVFDLNKYVVQTLTHGWKNF